MHYPKPRGVIDVLFNDADLLFAAAFEHWAHSFRLPSDLGWSVLDLRPIR